MLGTHQLGKIVFSTVKGCNLKCSHPRLLYRTPLWYWTLYVRIRCIPVSRLCRQLRKIGTVSSSDSCMFTGMLVRNDIDARIKNTATIRRDGKLTASTSDRRTSETTGVAFIGWTKTPCQFSMATTRWELRSRI